MSLATVDNQTREELPLSAPTVLEIPETTTTTTLYDTLHNSLILSHTVPYLPISSLLHLAAASRSFRGLIFQTPGVFRHLDLSQIKSVQFDVAKIDQGGEVWRNAQVDENLTEDDFYSGPLRGIFSPLRQLNILQNVQTLVLDGLSVTAELCHDIISDPSFNVRILSIRDVKNLNQGKLRQTLQYACRPSRPEGSLKLRALYVFGSKDKVQSQNALASPMQNEGDAWWSKKGRIISRPISEEWVNCMLACDGIIAFDAVLCHGPRHRNSPSYGKTCVQTDGTPAVATYAVPACDSCGDAPEGMMHSHSDSGSIHSRPLLSPPPLLSSSLRAATTPRESGTSFVPRCFDCIRERYCTGCQKWWCESCYQLPGQGSGSQVVVVDDETLNAFGNLDLEAPTTKVKSRVSKSCWECGNNCDDCINRTQRVCRKCCAGYCITHNEGSSMTHCDWCVSRGRGLGRL